MGLESLRVEWPQVFQGVLFQVQVEKMAQERIPLESGRGEGCSPRLSSCLVGFLSKQIGHQRQESGPRFHFTSQSIDSEQGSQKIRNQVISHALAIRQAASFSPLGGWRSVGSGDGSLPLCDQACLTQAWFAYNKPS